MLKKYLTSLFILLSFFSFSQKDKDWKKVQDIAVSYQLPSDWNTKPFSKSKICDCPGTLNTNGRSGDAMLSLVIYPCESTERLDDLRMQVGGFTFLADGPERKVKHGGIDYKLELGTFEGKEGFDVVWRLHSVGKTGKDKKHLVVYFYGDADPFQDNTELFKEILNSFKLTKV